MFWGSMKGPVVYLYVYTEVRAIGRSTRDALFGMSSGLFNFTIDTFSLVFPVNTDLPLFLDFSIINTFLSYTVFFHERVTAGLRARRITKGGPSPRSTMLVETDNNTSLSEAIPIEEAKHRTREQVLNASLK